MITKSTYINALRDAMPDVFLDDEMALRVVDLVFSVPMKGLENGARVELPGLGVISIDKRKVGDCLSFSPEGAHITCMGSSHSLRAA